MNEIASLANCEYDHCVELGGEPDCEDVTFYSEPMYRGESLVIESAEDCLTFEPKSICVPNHMRVTLYDLC